jgi:hypothetical protein
MMIYTPITIKIPIPVFKQMPVAEAVVIDKKHGYRVSYKKHDDIKGQHPDSGQGVVGLLSEKEIAKLVQESTDHSLSVF